MLGQNELMRRNALGSFRTMLEEISKDPAMLIWLDTSLSKKGTANENYSRELMELFSLGIGNYTEQDVREGARAFTGWEIVRDKFHLEHRPARQRPVDVPRQEGKVGWRRHRADLPRPAGGAVFHHRQVVSLFRQRYDSADARAAGAAGHPLPPERLQSPRISRDDAPLESVLLAAGLSHTDQVAGRFRHNGKSGSCRMRLRWTHVGGSVGAGRCSRKI